jgi:hypothetical protein
LILPHLITLRTHAVPLYLSNSATPEIFTPTHTIISPELPSRNEPLLLPPESPHKKRRTTTSTVPLNSTSLTPPETPDNKEEEEEEEEDKVKS